jgi:hypothetical protein
MACESENRVVGCDVCSGDFLHLGQCPKPLPFRTEHVVYAILAFSMATIVVLAYLTANGPHPLPTEVTTGFVGTVVGGTLTTIRAEAR